MRELNNDFIAQIEALRRRPGGDVLHGLLASLENDQPIVSIRTNPRKCDGALPLRRVAWSDNGYYIDGDRPRFTFDPALHQGRYYVQDASSMVVGAIVKTLVARLAGGPVVYIDACAAPGGKTTAAIDALPDGSLVIANEYDRRRAEVLCENIVKWGYPDVVVTQGDTAKYAAMPAIADIVAADVPCSGEGMMRKEAVAVEQWSAHLVEQCATLQRSIVDNMWKALRPGGFFIYSTCTFNHKENEENLAYMVETLGAEPVALPDFDGRIAGAIDSPYPALRFLPGRVEGEGLFVAVVRKPLGGGDAAASADKRREKSKAAKRPSATVPGAVASWVDEEGYALEVDGDRVVAISNKWKSLVADLRKQANVIYAGTEVAYLKGKEPVPSQALALSRLCPVATFPRQEVDYATALQYLSRQAVALADAPKGYVLLTYGGEPLGFVKNLGNRANNLYPQAWAIRSSYLPDCPLKLI